MQVIAEDLSHGFGDGPPLFQNLGFVLEPGRRYALTGPSGSGKSTLLSILAGWDTPRGGSVRRDGVAAISWVFQNQHGVARRTAVDHVALPLLAQGFDHRSARAEARVRLSEVGLDRVALSRFGELSGGEAQRLMLARGMAARPDLLLVDEPTAQLDNASSETVNRALAGLAHAETIVVVATHDLDTRDACTDVIDLSPQTSTSHPR